jgi:hypothetical protein
MYVIMNTTQNELLDMALQSMQEYDDDYEAWLKDYKDLEESWACEKWIERGLQAVSAIETVESSLLLSR